MVKMAVADYCATYIVTQTADSTIWYINIWSWAR